MFFTNPVGHTSLVHILFNKVVYGVAKLVHCVIVGVYWVPVLIHAVHPDFLQKIQMSIFFIFH